MCGRIIWPSWANSQRLPCYDAPPSPDAAVRSVTVGAATSLLACCSRKALSATAVAIWLTCMVLTAKFANSTPYTPSP